MSNNIVKKEYWEKYYTNFNIKKPSDKDTIVKLIKKYIPKNASKDYNAIEIWWFPWRYLSIFWDLWYKLNCIDIVDNINIMKDFLTSQEYIVEEIINEYFPINNNKYNNKYNVVCSFWFIEHFKNYDEIIIEHSKLVKKNWYLLITTPNFKYGFQYYFHKIFDKENFDRHVIESMNPSKWWDILKKEWFEIINLWYTWWFDYWTETENKLLTKKIVVKTSLYIRDWIKKILNIFNLWLDIIPNNKSYSPHCFIIAKKIHE